MVRLSNSEVNNKASFSPGKQHNEKHKLFDGAGSVNLGTWEQVIRVGCPFQGSRIIWEGRLPCASTPNL